MCRKQWKVMCLPMPASSSQSFSGWRVIWRSRPLKTSPLPRLPQSSRASAEMGRVVSVSVFSVLRRRQAPPSGYCSTLSQRRARMSLIRRPVRQLNRDAALSTGISHGVSARSRSSSRVRYSRRVSTSEMPSRYSLMFSLMRCSR